MQTRKVYEKYPYPATDKSVLTSRRWNLAPMEWIQALWRPNDRVLDLRRILVAGCGTGREAFALQRRFPKAQIVAVDFSPRSIEIARGLQRSARAMRNIRFRVADLTSPNLGKITGNKFDFISCHGVLSYVPNPENVLRTLKKLLVADGALHLGVNGAEHFSVRGRSFLPDLGLDLQEPQEGPLLRNVLRLWDAVLEEKGTFPFAGFPIGYLAGDLFGPLIHNLPLRDWVRAASNAGLHFQASCSSWRALRAVMEGNHYKVLLPRSRSEVCELLAEIRPETFHRILFTRQSPVNPPWNDWDELLQWRPFLTRLYKVDLPKRGPSWTKLRRVIFKSEPMNTRLEWQMPEWELEILRRGDGEQTLGAILNRISDTVPPRLLREQLYVLYQLLVISLSHDPSG
jgi:SAM-dependent methyltransferase